MLNIIFIPGLGSDSLLSAFKSQLSHLGVLPLFLTWKALHRMHRVIKWGNQSKTFSPVLGLSKSLVRVNSFIYCLGIKRENYVHLSWIVLIVFSLTLLLPMYKVLDKSRFQRNFRFYNYIYLTNDFKYFIEDQIQL